MRPIKLTVSAFGPYKGKLEIPMEKLGTQGLYVIAGDTGAGKTTIFDAITYALYGEPNGSSRTSKMLRSEYASTDTETFVELEFEYRGSRYIIKRRPEYLLPNRKTKVSSKAELIYPDSDKPAVTKIKEVNSAVEEIMGIDRNEFCQIAMIAQGEFAKLLKANTEERQKIYRRIFKTDNYSRLEERIKLDKKNAQDSYENKRKEIAAIVSGLAAPNGFEHTEELDMVRTGSMSMEHNLRICDELIATDNALLAALQTEEKAAEERIIAQKITIEKAKTAADSKEKLDKSKTLLAEKEKELDEKTKEQEDTEKLGEKYAALSRETEICREHICDYDRLDICSADIKSLHTALDTLKETLGKINTEAAQSTALLAEKRTAAQDEALQGLDVKKNEHEHKQKALLLRKDELSGLKDLGQGYSSAIEELAQARKQYIEVQRGCLAEKDRCVKLFGGRLEYLKDTLRKKQEETAKRQLALTEKLERLHSLQDTPQKKAELLAVTQELQNKSAELAALQRSKQELDDKHKRISDADAVLKLRTEKALTAAQEYYSAYRLFIANQAGLLARELEHGKPCPVCGSIHHPSPAALTEHSPDKAVLDTLEQRKNSAESERAEYSNAKSRLEAEYSEKLSALTKRAAQLFGEDFSFDNFDSLMQRHTKEIEDKITESELAMTEIESRLTLKEKLTEETERETSAVRREEQQNNVFAQSVTRNEERLSSITEAFSSYKNTAVKSFCRQTDTDYTAASSYEQAEPATIDTAEEPDFGESLRLETLAREAYEKTAALKENLSRCKATFEKSGKEIFGSEFDTENCDSDIENKLKAIDKEIAEQNEILNELNRKIELKKALEEEVQTLDEKIRSCEREKTETEKSMEKTESSLAYTQKEYDALRGKLKFADKAEAQQEIDKNERSIAEYNSRVRMLRESASKLREDISGLNGSISRLEESFEESDICDINQAEAILSGMLSEQEQNRHNHTAVSTRLAGNKERMDKLKKESAVLDKFEERFNMIRLIYSTVSARTADGSDSGKVKLETYIQTQYFDRIISHANTRLSVMTGGQYEFIRRRTADNKQSQAGLDLNVIDHFNETQRSVSSLSGGESFKASLALALGLSDEIQSAEGGICLDTMFVDEGFGSLDDESLQSALKMLIGLTNSGSNGGRLIGIISHVADLKNKIDKQILVTKDRENGSSVEIISE